MPWQPDADGWWHSQSLDVSFQPGRPYMLVRDRDGVVLPSSGAARRHARLLEQQLAEAERARADLDDLVKRLHSQLGEPDTAP